MRFHDLLTLPLAALWQQKGRTLLTTLGVVFGAFVLAASLSIGVGVRATIDRESHRSDISRRVDISPKWNSVNASPTNKPVEVAGEMADVRRDRIRKALAEQEQRTNPARSFTELTREQLRKLATIPHVERVVPQVYLQGFALLGNRSEVTQIVSARPDDEAGRRRIVAGRFFETPNERSAIITEFLAYRLGLTTDAEIDGLVGKTLRIEIRSQKVESGFAIYLMNRQGRASRTEREALDKVAARLPGSLESLGLTKPESDELRKAIKSGPATAPLVVTEEFTVVGVLRAPTDDDLKVGWSPLNSGFDFVLPYATATDLFFKGTEEGESGVNQALLLVDKEENVKDVVASVLSLGVEAHAALEFIERERFIYVMIFGGMTCVAAVALLVSALGIANTMLMSVLERTREIGIMKAVGADGRHLQFIFLVEGGLIGLLGALIGLLLAWGASFPGDAWVRSMVLSDIKIDLKGSIFVFPSWIVATVLVFTVLVTTLAAVYPARRASKIDPVSALRHE
jgi:putative ABC transport system permease protein